MVVGTLVLAAVVVGAATAAEPRPPGPNDRCVVCGMFVAKYPTWIATAVFEDGSRVFFDGPKDLFKFLLDPEKYGHEKSSIEDVLVTDYYTTELVNATESVFVVGSDVVGPMGPELVPIANPEHAKSFRADHGGDKVLAFDQVTPDVIPE